MQKQLRKDAHKRVANGGGNPAKPPDTCMALDERETADLAYRLWLERGCPEGSPDRDWFEAERALQAAKAG
jgi:hypothetical protein